MAPLAMAIWAFAEAIIWPIIPDFLLAPMIIAWPRRTSPVLAACIAGSAVGAALIYALAWTWPAEAVRALPHLPLVFEADIAVVRQRIAQDGAFAFLWQPISGIPFKVWAVVAAENAVPPVIALPLAILARAARMTVVATVAALVGARFGQSIRDHWLILLALYVIVFALGWARTFPSSG
jgi:membrane protein YqaA with SNARE-associated domain